MLPEGNMCRPLACAENRTYSVTMATDAGDPEHRVIAAIEGRMKANRITRKAVYTAAGLARSTFEDKMKNGGFRLREVIRILNFLHLDFDKTVR